MQAALCERLHLTHSGGKPAYMLSYPQGGALELQPDNPMQLLVSELVRSTVRDVDADKAAVNSLAVGSNYFVSLKVNFLDFFATVANQLFFSFLFFLAHFSINNRTSMTG